MTWLLVIYILAYDAPPVKVEHFRTKQGCELAAKTWRTEVHNKRGKAVCLPIKD